MLHVVFQTVTVFVGEPVPSCLQIHGGTGQKIRLLLRGRIVRPQGLHLFSRARLRIGVKVENVRNAFRQFLCHGLIRKIVYVIVQGILGGNLNPVVPALTDDSQGVFVCGQKQVKAVCRCVVPLLPLVKIAYDRVVWVEIISVHIGVCRHPAFLSREGIQEFRVEGALRKKVSGHTLCICGNQRLHLQSPVEQLLLPAVKVHDSAQRL